MVGRPFSLFQMEHPEGNLHLDGAVWTRVTELEALVQGHVLTGEQLAEGDLQVPQGTLVLLVSDLNFKVLALGIVNEESEVFLPYWFIGFVSNLALLGRVPN